MKGELSRLQIQNKELRENQFDLYTKADSTYVMFDVLSASLQDLQNKISVLSQAIHDLKVVTDKRSKSNDQSVLPSFIYQNAYGDYLMAKFDLAYSGFQSFADKYPNAELVPQAQFYMGECFYSMSMWDKALEEYKKVEQRYKKRSDLVSSARLKIALCCQKLDKNEEAIRMFSSIIKDFPQSPESLTAKESIEIYNNAQKR
ncbi:tetratricopeptide repeat protein [Candidatus Endomicrobiellum trichonymphae]|uniref:tetratricopeptide repeat protein n=1 Tax=Endomicrobium trichonymphae TaxID=1408204 RepID=UPI000171845A|nr:tetratricopeptide repeat protein [Candidatus Endomicrobium trichonymphae]